MHAAGFVEIPRFSPTQNRDDPEGFYAYGESYIPISEVKSIADQEGFNVFAGRGGFKLGTKLEGGFLEACDCRVWMNHDVDRDDGRAAVFVRKDKRVPTGILCRSLPPECHF